MLRYNQYGGMHLLHKKMKIREAEGSNLYALLGYIILTLILTYPVIFRISSHIPGYFDVYIHVWNMWWVKKSLIDLGVMPYYTYYLFYPTGVSLVYHVTYGIFNSMISIPLQIIFGTLISYNIIWLFSFIMSGYGMYLLVKYLTNDEPASFIAGIIFAFCPYHFAHGLSHLAAMSSWTIPLYVLYLFKTTRENNKNNAILAAIFLALASLCDWHYTVYLIIFTGLFLLYYLYNDRSVLFNKAFVKRFLILVSLFGLVILPFIYPMLVEFSHATYMTCSIIGSIVYSADIVAFFIPSTLHPIFGQFVEGIYANFTGNQCEYTVFIGYTVLILALYSVLKVERKKIKFWIFSSLIFFILSLGPILHINGIFLIPNPGLDLDPLVQIIGLSSRGTGIAANILQSGIPIPLPGLIIPFIPLLNISRVQDRFTLMLMLSLAVIAGYGCKELFSRINNREKSRKIYNKKIVACLITAVILFEFLAVPYPLSNASVPRIYEKIFTNSNSEDYAILELPFNGRFISEFMYYQTYHGKKLVGGATARTPPYAIKFTDNTPFIKQLYNPYPYLVNNYEQKDIFVIHNSSKLTYNILNYYNIRYIVLHKDVEYYDYYKCFPQLSIDFESMNDLLKTTLKTIPIYEDENLVIYNSRTVEPPTPFLILDENWHEREYWDTNTTSWVEDIAIFEMKKTSSFSFKYGSEDVKRILVEKTRPLNQYLKLERSQSEKNSYHNQSTRWMENNATLIIVNPYQESIKVKIKFVAISFYKARTLNVYLNDELLNSHLIGTKGEEILSPQITVPPGENTIKFYTPQCCDKPSDLSEECKDSRCLSIAFQNISLIRVYETVK